VEHRGPPREGGFYAANLLTVKMQKFAHFSLTVRVSPDGDWRASRLNFDVTSANRKSGISGYPSGMTKLAASCERIPRGGCGTDTEFLLLFPFRSQHPASARKGTGRSS
jgi:hypothetical protein